MSLYYKPFPYIYQRNPIDFFDGALATSCDEELRVLENMPETPRDSQVYKIFFPASMDCIFSPVFLCKADNNGTLYVFSDFDLEKAFADFERV